MAWVTPIIDRTTADTKTARANQANEDNNKGALNYQDLNRIEDNYRELIQWLEKVGYHFPHTYRKYRESFNGITYTDWQEVNIPWQSEIKRIRENYNALVTLYLINLDLPILQNSSHFNWEEANNLEKIALVGKTSFESMKRVYPVCGVPFCGQDAVDCMPYENADL